MDENVTVEDEDQVSEHIPECKWNKEWDYILEHTGCQARVNLPTFRRIREGQCLCPLAGCDLLHFGDHISVKVVKLGPAYSYLDEFHKG